MNLARAALSFSEAALENEALELAARLKLAVVDSSDSQAARYDFLLTLTPARLELREPGSKVKPLFVDFGGGKSAYRKRQRGPEPLARAVGVKGTYKPYVLDATAGLGQDAFVLAAAGCRVKMLERSAVIAALLQDGLTRALCNDEVKLVARRMMLHTADALEYLHGVAETELPEVIYLDPMYPVSAKSAAKRKSMRIFRALVGADEDAAELLALALNRAKRRVVVKRPLKAPSLIKAPSGSLAGRTTRFDIYSA